MRRLLVVPLVLSLLLLVPTSTATAPSSFFTDGLQGSGVAQATLGGFSGIAINYNDTYSSPIAVFVYVDLTNSAGQTVFVWNTYGNISSHKILSFYIPIFGVPPGTYSAAVFALTNSRVPTSGVTHVQVVL
jgi:hypothetical protein